MLKIPGHHMHHSTLLFFLSPGGERFPHLNFISLALRWPTRMFQDILQPICLGLHCKDILQPICLGLHYRIKDRAPGHANNKITAIVIETSTLYLGAYPHHQISICGYRLEIHCVLVNPWVVARSKKVSWAFMDSWAPELRLL